MCRYNHQEDAMGQIKGPSEVRSTERRKTPRFGVEFWVEEHSEAGVYYHRVTNLSRNGLFIEKKIPFRVGQTLLMSLDLPGAASKLDARSRVINNYRDGQANLRGTGFQFLDLDTQTREGIEAFIERAHLQAE
jgi:Tfp pilus assembly protein PilZ